MLHPGIHVTAVGSDAEHTQELSARTVAAADRFVCDHLEQSLRLGELRGAVHRGFDADRAVTLGAVVKADAPGRRDPDDVTICDLTGTGARVSLKLEGCPAHHRVVLEGGGAVGVAALLAGRLAARGPVVIVASGANAEDAHIAALASAADAPPT